MKTNIFSSKEAQNYLYIGLLSLFMVSCGSYQNSSYYESDGIYGATTPRNVERRNTPSANYYKDYFNSLQNDSQPEEVFTDIDKYSGLDSNDNNSYSSYAGWGSNQTGTIVNVYPNYWGMNSGFGYSGWGYPYSYGWNNPYYGFGWNSWGLNYGFGYSSGWGYPYYGYNNSFYYYNRPNNSYHSYAPSRRGSVSNSTDRNYAPTRSYSTSRNSTNDRTYSTNRLNTSRNNTFTNPRTYNSTNNTNNTQTTTRRSATQTQPQYQNNTNRQQNTNSRNESYTPPTRSYSTPSYGGGESSGRSYGGGNSGGGGTRSSGGGRR